MCAIELEPVITTQRLRLRKASKADAARLASFAELVQDAAAGYAPHQVAFYLKDLAADFHSWYNAERMLVEDEAVKLSRLALAAAVRQVLVTGLKMLGVSAPESM